MSTYPPANTSAAWYQDNFPGAVLTPRKGVIHTTETTSLPGYSGGSVAPNYTAVPDFANKRLHWFAHFPDERSSRALKNLAGGVETNTDDVIQVELVGTCDPSTHGSWKSKLLRHIFWPEAPSWALGDLAEFVAYMNRKHEIPVRGPIDSPRWTGYPESFGPGGQRFTNARWNDFAGWCGHQHVPENTHGDPGSINWASVVTKAKAILAAPSPPERTPLWDALWEATDTVDKATPSTAVQRSEDIATIKRLAARWSVKH